MFESPADWVSPTGRDGYATDPPAADGSKIIIADVDHIWPRAFQAWVWKSFTRGLNTAFMDLYGAETIGIHPTEKLPRNWIEQTDTTRRNLGYTRCYARRMNLATAVPHGELSSTGYCLADPKSEYLVYQPEPDAFSVDLGGFAEVSFSAEWLDPDTGSKTSGHSVAGGTRVGYTPPFKGSSVLYLLRDGQEQT